MVIIMVKCKQCKQKVALENTEANLCPRCQREYTVANVYSHEWGIIVPKESGVIWQQQTKGILCHHVQIEGVYIPLDKPREAKENDKSFETIDLLSELKQANYNHNEEKIEKTWNKIKEQISFDFKEIERPSYDYPSTQEGIKWIKITDCADRKWENLSELIGENVVLVYPNCD